MTASCVYLWILRNFEVVEFQPPDTVKKLLHRCFPIIFTRTRNSHSKVFIYLKSLKTISEEVNLQ